MDHKKAGLWIKHCWTEPFIEAGDFVTLSMGFVKIQVDFENDSASAFLPHKGEKANFKIAIFSPGSNVFDEIPPFFPLHFFESSA
jgi:hypothetical protein